MDFSYRRRFRWPWQEPLKRIERSEVEHYLGKGNGDRVTVGDQHVRLPVRSKADLAEYDALAAGKPPEEKPELGQALLDLAAGGWSFHGAAGQIGLYGAYNAFTDANFDKTAVARNGAREVPLDPERTVRMAGFYNGNSLNARLEKEGYEFYSQGEAVAAFVAGPQSGLGRAGETWLDSVPSDETVLRGALTRFEELLSRTDDVGDTRQAIAILDGGSAPDQKARELVALRNAGVDEDALNLLGQVYPHAADATRIAMEISASREYLDTAVEDPSAVGIGQKFAREDGEVGRALLEAQASRAPDLVKLGRKLLDSESTEPGPTSAALLEEIDGGRSSAPADLARKLIAAQADPLIAMRTLRGTPGWESTVTFFDRVYPKLSYTETGATLAQALLAGAAPADKAAMLARVYQGLGEDDRDVIVAMALKHLEPGPGTKEAAALARALERSELALSTPALVTGQDVVAMGRAALDTEESMSEEAGTALCDALVGFKDTRDLGKAMRALTAEMTLEGTHYAFEQLLSSSGDLLTTGMAIAAYFRDPEQGDSTQDAVAMSKALLKLMGKQHVVAEKAYSLVGKQEDDDDGEISRIALEAIAAGRGSDLDSFRGDCVGLGVDEALERSLRGTPVQPIYKELAGQVESNPMREALLEAALRRPTTASKAETRELLGVALKAVERYDVDDEELLDSDRATLAPVARDMLDGASRKLADKLNEAVEPPDQWAVMQPLLVAGKPPASLDELAALGGEAARVSDSGELATNVLNELASYPETEPGRLFVHSMMDGTEGHVGPSLVSALCLNPRAATSPQLAAVGALALDNCVGYDEGPALAETLLEHFGEDPAYKASVALARGASESDLTKVAASALRHPGCDTGVKLGALGLDLYRQTENLEGVGLALDAMASCEDTADGASVAREVYEGASYESVALLADTLCTWSQDLNTLAVQLKAAADRGETAGDEEPEAAFAGDAELLRASAMKLEALALTKQQGNSQIEERGHAVVVGGIAVPVRPRGA